MSMYPMEPGPQDFDRRLAEDRHRMREAQAIVVYADKRTGLLPRFLQRMADRIDPTGETRRQMR